MKERLYSKVKIVAGENFVTIEQTNQLSEKEIMILVDFLLDDKEIQSVDHLTILLNNECSGKLEQFLLKHEFNLHDEQIFVRCELLHLDQPQPTFKLKSLREVPDGLFKSVWENSMRGSLNGPSYLNMDEQLKSVEKELGPTYVDTCNIAFEGEVPIGVVMPHIEPGTEKEGRIFYFGLVPEARGKGKSSLLYKQGLYMLKDLFGAAYSVGATSVNNLPMQKVFEKNQCKVIERIKAYKRFNGGKNDGATYNG